MYIRLIFPGQCVGFYMNTEKTYVKIKAEIINSLLTHHTCRSTYIRVCNRDIIFQIMSALTKFNHIFNNCFKILFIHPHIKQSSICMENRCPEYNFKTWLCIHLHIVNEERAWKPVLFIIIPQYKHKLCTFTRKGQRNTSLNKINNHLS